jgi:beta-aspartyl-peptidase (threonine type)
MDGRDLAAGAVGAMQGYKHAISVARKVMDNLPHVFLVGQGAGRFAAEMGFERCDLLTEEARQVWEERLRADMSEEALNRLAERPDLWKWVEMAADPERAKGTVNFVARDSRGGICAGVSTSGWAWKYPGRLGDSPVIGAGLYADSRYGGAACTGMGEMAIRASTAHGVVIYLKAGLSLVQAGQQAMEDLNGLGGRYLSRMSFIAVDRRGRHAGFSNAEDGTYIYMTDGMEEPEEVERTYIRTKEQWGRV